MASSTFRAAAAAALAAAMVGTAQAFTPAPSSTTILIPGFPTGLTDSYQFTGYVINANPQATTVAYLCKGLPDQADGQPADPLCDPKLAATLTYSASGFEVTQPVSVVQMDDDLPPGATGSSAKSSTFVGDWQFSCAVEGSTRASCRNTVHVTPTLSEFRSAYFTVITDTPLPTRTITITAGASRLSGGGSGTTGAGSGPGVTTSTTTTSGTNTVTTRTTSTTSTTSSSSSSSTSPSGSAATSPTGGAVQGAMVMGVPVEFASVVLFSCTAVLSASLAFLL